MIDLKAFREKVHEYYRPVYLWNGPEPRKATQKDLAEAISLNPTELNKRLNGRATLSEYDVRAIVKALAKWQAITIKAQAFELLEFMNCPAFSQAEWEAEPLSKLMPP